MGLIYYFYATRTGVGEEKGKYLATIFTGWAAAVGSSDVIIFLTVQLSLFLISITGKSFIIMPLGDALFKCL